MESSGGHFLTLHPTLAGLDSFRADSNFHFPLLDLAFHGTMIAQTGLEDKIAATSFPVALAHRFGHPLLSTLVFRVCLAFSPVSLVPPSSLILIRLHVTAHTPGVAGVGLTVAVHEANAEVHEPRVGPILGTRGRRPITGRLNIAKGMA